MFKRNLKQKILLSFIPPHRIQAVIDDPTHQVYKRTMIIKDGKIKVINPEAANANALYRAFQKVNSSAQKFYDGLCATHMDYNSDFKKRTGMTLEEYEAAHL